MSKLGLIDYGAGNFSSVRNALEYLKLEYVRIDNPVQLDEVSHIILPGVGAFASAMGRLKNMGFIEGLGRQVNVLKKPFLGICVGMQVLADIGYEFGECNGLGFISGAVKIIEANKYAIRLPHIGWNELKVAKNIPLLNGMNANPIFYFVHSYEFVPSDRGNIAATCEYGEEVVAIINKENVYGVQFHPEKSQSDGLLLLKNFSRI